jgi:hypothetical protein
LSANKRHLLNGTITKPFQANNGIAIEAGNTNRAIIRGSKKK